MISKVRRIIKRIKEEVPDCESSLRVCYIIFDFALCKMRYHVTFEEYRQYAFYNLKHNAKKNYITEYDVLECIPRQFIAEESKQIFNDKHKFNMFFKDMLGRDFCYIVGNNYNEFYEFCQKHDYIMIKPINQWCGHGVEKMKVDEVGDLKKFYYALVKKYEKCLIEEVILQDDRIASLNPDSVNTIRVVTLIDEKQRAHIACAAIRIGRQGACIDNFCSGGMAAAIDVESGIIISNAFDKNGICYYVHPDTKKQIIGFKIPEWKKIKASVVEIAERIPTARFAGWDVVIRNDGKICFIEGNCSPGARTIQMPLKKGIRDVYEQYLGKIIRNK